MRWKNAKKHLPDDGATVLGFWGIEKPGSFGVVTYAGNGLWHEPEDDEDDFRAPEFWMVLPDSPLDGDEGSRNG